MKRRRIGYVILSSSSWALQPKAITSQRMGPQNDVASTNPNDDVLYPLQNYLLKCKRRRIGYVILSSSSWALQPKAITSQRMGPQNDVASTNPNDDVLYPLQNYLLTDINQPLLSKMSPFRNPIARSCLNPRKRCCRQISHNVTLTTPPADRPCQPQYDSVSIPRDTKRAKKPTAKLTSATSMPTYSMTSSNLLPADTSKPKITKISRIVLRREIDPKTTTPHRNRDSKPQNL
ncbi:far upstream element-binding protein 1-like [Dorcoceras hygrometricum]|uniref:Far upstream element-binding protein 1-like n=1 Tax=Dorcoceras hygrometricum TaxID=472368 RepID=A0A2Z7CW49_9LAMI|nr:far upstream element-binding protein 1-like [Dorcoceras hygrometricum]